jgi:hypothetical protein
MKRSRSPKQFLHKHSLSLAALGVVVLLIALYCRSNPATHIGSFFGNAIADWTGVLITVVMTKHLCAGSVRNGERALSASEYSALRAGIFKA